MTCPVSPSNHILSCLGRKECRLRCRHLAGFFSVAAQCSHFFPVHVQQRLDEGENKGRENKVLEGGVLISGHEIPAGT